MYPFHCPVNTKLDLNQLRKNDGMGGQNNMCLEMDLT